MCSQSPIPVNDARCTGKTVWTYHERVQGVEDLSTTTVVFTGSIQIDASIDCDFCQSLVGPFPARLYLHLVQYLYIVRNNGARYEEPGWSWVEGCDEVLLLSVRNCFPVFIEYNPK